MKYFYSQVCELLDSYSSFLTGKFPNRYKVFALSKNNQSLFDWLSEIGYFDFVGKTTQIVGYHQIIAFLFTKHLDCLPQNTEVHHIDGNTVNNHPSNLMYLSEADHRLVTKHQRKATRIKLKKLAQSSHSKTTVNRRGKLIHNWIQFILSVIAVTCIATAKWFGQYNESRPINKVVAYILKLFKSCSQSLLKLS